MTDSRMNTTTMIITRLDQITPGHDLTLWHRDHGRKTMPPETLKAALTGQRQARKFVLNEITLVPDYVTYCAWAGVRCEFAISIRVGDIRRILTADELAPKVADIREWQRPQTP